MFKKFRSKSWYTYTVALCIAVVLYVVLIHLPAVIDGLQSFGRYFNTVVIGCIVAYLMNPLAMLYERKVCKNLKKGRWGVSVILAFATFVVAITALVLTILPQMVISITAFVANVPTYQEHIHAILEKLGATSFIYVPGSANEAADQVIGFLKGYGDSIAAFMTDTVKGLVNIVIGAVLAIYLLAAKATLKKDMKALLSALLMDDKLDSVLYFIKRCDRILNRYMVFSLLDAMIVGGVTAVAMLILRMPYVGLIAVIAAITNLIPTFGPVIGAVIGGFFLLLVNPIYAVIFIGITVVLQIADGYIIKPKLFGNSLGVSGLLILIAIVAMGNAFGVGGILLAIPVAAICDFTYREGVLPYLQRRKAAKQAAADAGDEAAAEAEDEAAADIEEKAVAAVAAADKIE